jgi:hypothetical protein
LSYAEKDNRIKVKNNKNFVNGDENHNIAFRLISPNSMYCKVVSADDWILPECLCKMVDFAQQHSTVGIIGSYQSSDGQIKWKGLHPSVSYIKGKDACRLGLLEGVHIFPNPTASLYRSDLVRMRDSFFPHTRPHADTSVCYEYLQFCDFGFIHEILSVERVHAGQMSSYVDSLAAGTVAYLEILFQYGRIYLNNLEYDTRKKEMFQEYYRFLGGCLLKLNTKEFWMFHSSRLREMGYVLDWKYVLRSSVKEILLEIRNPKRAIMKGIDVVIGRFESSYLKRK